jgi:hypothetical protein
MSIRRRERPPASVPPGFATVRLAVEQGLSKKALRTAAVQNALNRQYLAGFTPTPIIGAPQLWRVGLAVEVATPLKISGAVETFRGLASLSDELALRAALFHKPAWFLPTP